MAKTSSNADLRSNLATYAVPAPLLPVVGAELVAALPTEIYDKDFNGQALRTTYFDTPAFELRKARRGKTKYLTIRVRCYQSASDGEHYALSAKTESQKWRRDLTEDTADALLEGSIDVASQLPPDLAARLRQLATDRTVPVVTVSCRRYAVEDDIDRYTLDVDVSTDRNKSLPVGVLEFKSTKAAALPAPRIASLSLRHIKLSKFLWSTEF
jgi:hypothetical protein